MTNTYYILIFIFVLSVSFTDIVRARPNSHVSIGVMGEHGHKAGDRFMAMDMQGLQSGTESIKTAKVLKDFMMVPTSMDMKVHLLGVVLVPPAIKSRITKNI